MVLHKKILHTFSRFLPKGDKYVVIEVLNHYVQVTVLRTDLGNKQIRILKAFSKDLPQPDPHLALKELRRLLRKIPRLSQYRIVVGLDSLLATTKYASISLVRPNAKEVIDEADLDNLISQAIWRFFDKHRFRIAQKMGIDEVDVLLTDVRIRDIRIDGHRVVNPIGFKAKSVEVFFSQTFVSRGFMAELREAVPREQIELLVEAGTALSHVLAQAHDGGAFYMANLFPSHTAVFAAAHPHFGHEDSFAWGGDNLVRYVSRSLHVDPETAVAVIRAYAESEGSEQFLKKFEGVVTHELGSFANGVESLVDRDVPDVYLNPFFPIPEVVFSSRFQNRFDRPLRLLPLSTQFVTEKLGYTVQYNKAASGLRDPLMLYGVLLELALLPRNDTMSHLADRRVRWLVT